MSSPSRRVIDPLICSYSDSPETKSKPSAPLPPPSKLLHQASGAATASGAPAATGTTSNSWTPLGSHTFTNDVMSHSSTPSSKIFSTLFKQGATGPSPDFDFPGLNLTPFLNLVNNPGASASANFTPLYDKSIHMADFFMDSPIRPSTKVDTITPSRFAPQHKPSGLSAKKSLQSKRSITSLDTPARHPKKKLDKDEAESSDESDEDVADTLSKGFEEHFVTPSKKKVLGEVSGNLLNKTPIKTSVPDKNKFQTPAAHPVSSPSTVIVSSAVKSPSPEQNGNPPSPTPVKESKSEEQDREPTQAGPVMGVFNEKRAPPKMADPKKSAKKTQGLNRFQIVFTDVHTLMNGKKKKGKLERKKGPNSQPQAPHQPVHNPLNSVPPSHSNAQTHPNPSHSHPPSSQGSLPSQGSFNQSLSGSSFTSYNTSLPTSQDFNTSINTSKEFSISTNSSMSHNMTSADHASFDMMHGGLISTPNGKYLLDHSFDRHSPSGRKSEPKMLPPKTISLQQAAQQAAHHAQHAVHGGQRAHGQETGAKLQGEMPMNMVMSTPQHANIRMGGLMEEASPSNKEMAFLYQNLHYQDSPDAHVNYKRR